MARATRTSQATEPAHGPAGAPPERFGPAERLVGGAEPVPPVPTIPYTLGQTPRQQNRILAISVFCWLVVLAILFLSG